MVSTGDEPILRAFGGGPLRGDKPVRYAHIDEAGISEHEPNVTVAGVLSHADRELRAIAARIDEIRRTLPEELRSGLIFHAKDIWHGNNDFDWNKWDQFQIHKEERRALVTQLCRIPKEFGLPVVCGFVGKNDHDWTRTLQAKEIKNLTANRANYALAFSMCCISIEAHVRGNTPDDEVAQIIAENTNEMREHAEWAFDLLSDPESPWSDHVWHREFLPLERICETPHFVKKNKSSVLQVADAIAFVFNRHITRGVESDVGHCFDEFKDLISFPFEIIGE